MKHFHVSQGGKKSAKSTSESEATNIRGWVFGNKDSVTGGKTELGESNHGGKAQIARVNRQEESSKAVQKGKEGGASKQKGKTFALHTGSDEDEDLNMTLPKNAGVMQPPDAEKEFDDAMRAGGSKAPEEPSLIDNNAIAKTHCVHESAKNRRYVMKNEKVKRFAEVKVCAFVYAPACDGDEDTNLFAFKMEDLNISNKTERLAMQRKLADESMSKILSTLVIVSMNAEGSASTGAQGTCSLMAAIPFKMPLQGTDMDEVREIMQCEPHEEIVYLLGLDPEIVKRVFKMSQCTLPATYNPITSHCNKFKVPTKLEDQAKFDNNFVLIGAAEKTKRAPKRAADDLPKRSCANVKRAATSMANGAGDAPDDTASASASAQVSHSVEKGEVVQTLVYKPMHNSSTVQCAAIECDKDETFSVMKFGKGRYWLIKSPI